MFFETFKLAQPNSVITDGSKSKRSEWNKDQKNDSTGKRKTRRYTHDHYFHRCGYDVNHTRATWKWVKPEEQENHQPTATADNPMGGSMRNMHLRTWCCGRATAVDNNTIIKNNYYRIQQLLPSSKIPPTIEYRTVDNDTVADKNKIQGEGHLDTAATGHFVATSCRLLNKTPTPNGLIVQCANSSHMQATDNRKLYIPSLPENATTAHVFPDMKTALILVPELCDADCLLTFQKSYVTV